MDGFAYIAGHIVVILIYIFVIALDIKRAIECYKDESYFGVGWFIAIAIFMIFGLIKWYF